MFKSSPTKRIINYDSKKQGKELLHKNELIPNGVWRAILCAPSGAGKTNLMLNLIYDMLRFDKIYLYARNSEQTVYQDLIKHLEKIAADADVDINEIFHFGSSLDDVVPVDNIDKNKVNVVIFDDFLLAKDQSVIEDYFVRGRHKKCITFYLAQSYSAIPITVRRNTRLYMFWKASRMRDVTLFHSDTAPEMDKKEFLAIFNEATKVRHNFLFVDVDEDDTYKKFRRNLSDFRVK